MNRSDRVRRAVSLTLTVLCFLVVPQLAFGQFSSSKAPTLSVSTVELVTPTDATGTYTCKTGFFSEGADVNVTGLTAAGQPGGVSYVYKLYRGTTQRATTTTASMPVSLSTGLQLIDLGNTTYRLTIVTKLGSWSAPEHSRTFTCGSGLPRSGAL